MNAGVFCVAAVVVLASGPALAQDTTRVTPPNLATFSGRVFVDSTRQPIIGAEVAFLDIVKSVLADERGAFRITGIPAGTHRLTVRRIGYGALETNLAFAEGETTDRNIFLARAVRLDSVRTTAPREADLEFEENRRLGLGHFLTRKDLEKVGEASLSSVLAMIPGIRIAPSLSPGKAWVVNSRRAFLEGDAYRTGDPNVDRGARLACYVNVVLDGFRMYAPRRPDDPLFDINSIRVDQIETIEYYIGATQLPGRYQGPGADACGVLVIRTRR
jgi:hypothetical protein